MLLCIRSALIFATVSSAAATNIAGYTTSGTNDITQHLRIDLDLQYLINLVSKPDLASAYTQYSQGGNSSKNNGDIRTIQGFSTDTSKLVGEKWYDIFTAYWGNDLKYADTFTTNACKGQGDFALSASGVTPVITSKSLGQGCMKGAQYQNMPMYVIHEMESAIADCKAKKVGTHWDEAVAFYSGSLILADPVSESGVLQYGLAEKRCSEFNTCTSGTANKALYSSAVNEKVFYFFKAGRDMQSGFQCETMESTKEEIVKQFTVPLVQGVMKYFYLAPYMNDEKSKAELWSFAAALLPFVNHYSPSAAATLRDNAYILNKESVKVGFVSAKASLESVYPAMGITCLDVGGFTAPSGVHVFGMEPCIDTIYGYTPANDVGQHLKLDLDQGNLNTAVAASDLTLAYTFYSQGGNSLKSDGSIRTIKGFSTDTSKLVGEKWYDIFTTYWNGDLKYADTFTTNACKGQGDFTLKSSSPVITTISQGQGCMKGAQYQNMPMYVIHEMESAISDCKAKKVGTHWDEAVAFYSGSFTLSSPNIGVFQYGLAEKRCADFNTCGEDSSAVNEKVLLLFALGRDLVPGFYCDALESVKESLVKQFTIPLVQGVIKYLHLTKTEGSEEDRAELWSFSAALLPFVNHYSTSAAATLKSNSYILSPNNVPDGVASVKASLEALYPAMGITCLDVGGYTSPSGSRTYVSGMEPCIDIIKGYTPANDVGKHLNLDLDQLELEAAVFNSDLPLAYKYYSKGENSIKSDGTVRTIQGFSTDTSKLVGEKWYDIFTTYWNGDLKYADTFTSNACLGKGIFALSAAGVSPMITTISQGQGCMKGAQYQNMPMYVIHEMESAIIDCKAKKVGTHWDEAVAFYTGSSTLRSASNGVFQYGLAEKRCADFNTCGEDSSAVNEKVMQLFGHGRDLVSDFKCDSLENVKELLVKQFTVPLVQGVIKYLYLAPYMDIEKGKAELWAFASAVLPFVDHYSPNVARILRDNTFMLNDFSVPDGVASVKASLEALYPAMGITCLDVGGYTAPSGSGKYISGMEPCIDTIYGYTPANDVGKHLNLDLDMLELQEAVSDSNLALAFKYYSEGESSIKSDGSVRTIQGFSDNNKKLVGEKWFDIFAAYWNNDLKYADTFTTNACKGQGDFTLKSSSPVITTISQGQGCMKGAQYQNMPMYVIHEMESAVADCKAKKVGTHWDEAVAFYTGSLTLTGSDIGVFQYGLAEKRCADFNTCGEDSSAVNEKVMALFSYGRDLVPGFKCSALESVKESLVKQFTIPLVQGVIKYLYLATTGKSEKEKAELWAFSAALLPFINHYSSSAAATLRKNSYILNANAVSDGVASVKASLEVVYPAMGITCLDVGGYLDTASTSTYVSGMEPCIDIIKGYTPASDIGKHLNLDLDQLELEAAVFNSDLPLAYKYYSKGESSIKSDGSVRTIQGFSTDTSKLVGEKWYDIFTTYWGNDLKYADTFTSNACLGKGDFALSASGVTPMITTISQGQGCMKGAQYQNMPMYVIHEMESAIIDCKAKKVGTHWDEAVAFYTGSMTLTGSNIGVFQYGLAEKRCADFNTCAENSDGVNEKVLALFARGRDMVPGFQCEDMESTKESLVKQFTIPLVQGVIKYLYLADTGNTEKEKAELWAFTAALLPFVNHYSPSAAAELRANAYILNPVTVPSGFVAAKASLEAAYSAMGMSCADVGGYRSNSDNSKYAYGMEPCDDNSTQKKSVQFKDRDINSATPAEIAVAVLVVLFVLLLLGLTLYFCRSRLCLCCGGARKGDALLHDQHGAEMSRV